MVHCGASTEQRASKGERSFYSSDSGGLTEQDLPALSIADLQAVLRRREVSPRDVIDVLRARIEGEAEEIGVFRPRDAQAAKEVHEQANVNLPLGGVSAA